MWEYLRQKPGDDELQHYQLHKIHASSMGFVLGKVVLAMRFVKCPVLETASVILAEEMDTLGGFTAKGWNESSEEELFGKYRWVLRLMDAVELGLESGDLWGVRFQASSSCNSNTGQPESS